MRDQSDLSWANHPNADLRARITEYLAKGYKVQSLDEHTAVMTRKMRHARPAWLFINPLYLLKIGQPRTERVRITVQPDGDVSEQPL